MTDTVLKIDYNELPVTDMEAAKAFYAKAFGWTFLDYGPTYAAFENAGIDGGLRLEDKPFPTGALILLRAEDIIDAERRVEAAGGAIIERLDFPGGRRFHFTDPSGNQLAIYSEHGKYA
ncbi:VOC family protein [uncultured Maricaulis sp.]|uniref:VOC family protein n=1 Tax=uncultured Maricaulis sp. TaxID=174710 RepID=UPI0030DD8C2E